jgi:putative addiction module component (TIGR02574 family)
MSLSLDQIETEILSLPEDDRARLFGSLLRSFQEQAPDHEDRIAQIWAEEAERRDQAMDSGEEPGIPSEEVFQRLRSTLR